MASCARPERCLSIGLRRVTATSAVAPVGGARGGAPRLEAVAPVALARRAAASTCAAASLAGGPGGRGLAWTDVRGSGLHDAAGPPPLRARVAFFIAGAAAVTGATASAAATGDCRRLSARLHCEPVASATAANPRARAPPSRTANSFEEEASEPEPDDAYVRSQHHLLQPTSHNPTPTTVPPPIEGLSGHHLRHRSVTAVIGLPMRGQACIAKRLQHYLDFFHGAHTELLDVNDYIGRPNCDEEVLEALRRHFVSDNKHKHHHAIIYTTNAWLAAGSQWSGHSKSRRRWMKNALEAELQAELHLVEIQVNDIMEHNAMYIQRHKLAQDLPDVHEHIKLFSKRFVTIQEDGTEDDLNYIKVIDYNKKVVTNNMMQTFLGAKVARFLGNVHPYMHQVYLARCGETEYTTLRKIGGDSGLAPKGEIFAKRLAEFAETVVCKQAEAFACVTLDAAQARNLRQRLADRSGEHPGVVAAGRWDDVSRSPYGEHDVVHEGMRLTRLLFEGDDGFRDAPPTVSELLEAIGSGREVTLVFTDDTGADGTDAALCRLWTSALLRAKQTVAHFRIKPLQLPNGKVWEQLGHREYRNLNDMYAGEYEGLTIEEIAVRQPKEAELRLADKLGYRYPRGESYYDVIARLDDRIHTLESYQEPLMIVAHPRVLRLLYAYIRGIPREQAPDIVIPPHTVTYLGWDGATGITERVYSIGPIVK
mmetsp:Transcript_124092/g.356350  ORF Transcript_124092/g.356350 Transcript_124092/m.356350 type:complete len:707 (-) Transcript_124092:113-2233(-)